MDRPTYCCSSSSIPRACNAAMRAEHPVPHGERSSLPGSITTVLRPVNTPSIDSTGLVNWQKEIWLQRETRLRLDHRHDPAIEQNR